MAQGGSKGGPGVAESRVAQGEWSVLFGPTPEAGSPPVLSAVHDGTPLPGLTVTAEAETPGYWRVRVALPATLIGDRVAVVALRQGEGALARDLARVSVAAGQALLDDLAADVAALRAEMELLKSVVRQIGRSALAAPAPVATPAAPPQPTQTPLPAPLAPPEPIPVDATDLTPAPGTTPGAAPATRRTRRSPTRI
jgi:hypothetical protein